MGRRSRWRSAVSWKICSSFPSYRQCPLLFSTPSSICTFALCLQQRCVDRLLDLHTAAMHLDDLGSEGLDGSQDQFLVLEGSDAKAQYILYSHSRHRL